jgi:hypothetical protein
MCSSDNNMAWHTAYVLMAYCMTHGLHLDVVQIAQRPGFHLLCRLELVPPPYHSRFFFISLLPAQQVKALKTTTPKGVVFFEV